MAHGHADYRVPVPSRPSRRLSALAALVAVVALVVAGCTAPKNQASPTALPTSTLPAGGGLDAFYGQQLEWRTCDDLQCASAQVPLDYADPDGERVTVALRRSSATGDRLGSLFINPGGPGASGYDFLDSFLAIAGKDVLEHYDVVGFDPRGVQHSDRIRCLDGPEMDELTAHDPSYDTDEDIALEAKRWEQVGQQCLEETGDLLAHVDTVSAARDLDVLRAAVGDEKLSYVGFSYGTDLGATYAALFPTTVGRMVLDGALDPTLSADDVTVGQAKGFEGALRAYVADCQAGARCPLDGSVDDGMRQIKDFLDRVRAQPLSTGTDRPLTQALAFTGIAVTLYSQDSWGFLTQALTLALRGNGAGLLQASDVYYDRDPDGTYSTNATEAFWAINCVDDRSDADPAAMRDQAERIAEVAPTVGFFFSYGGVTCQDWSVPLVGGLDDYSAKGTPPIVVVGTTNDPATPYAWAESLADTLSTGVLVTHVGEGHTAYATGSTCVQKLVDAYLVDGTVPKDGVRCES